MGCFSYTIPPPVPMTFSTFVRSFPFWMKKIPVGNFSSVRCPECLSTAISTAIRASAASTAKSSSFFGMKLVCLHKYCTLSQMSRSLLSPSSQSFCMNFLSPALSRMLFALYRSPRSPSTVLFTCGSLNPRSIVLDRVGIPSETEYTFVVAPPTSMVSKWPNPTWFSVPFASNSTAFRVADGVGIKMSTTFSTLSRPLASTIFSRKTLRISSFAGSILSSHSSGITFSVVLTSFPPSFKIIAASSEASLLQPTTIGAVKHELASTYALCNTVSLSPPSQPPTNRIMSGFWASIRFNSSEVKS